VVVRVGNSPCTAEYANPNTQDGTEIAAIGETHVRIFKFGLADF